MGLRMLRKNVLVDLGPLTNVLGAKLIETPQQYKQISSRGTIVDVAPGCRLMGKGDVGKECVVGIIHHEDQRMSPGASKAVGLPEHWHFLVHEKEIRIVMTQ